VPQPPRHLIAAQNIMSELVTCGTIVNVVNSLVKDDQVPFTVQMLDMESVASSSSSTLRMVAAFSDGKNFCRMTLAKGLQNVVNSNQLQKGNIVIITNYVMQPLSDNSIAIICLDLAVSRHSKAVIGCPVEFFLIQIEV
jgi:hypothetical protein